MNQVPKYRNDQEIPKPETETERQERWLLHGREYVNRPQPPFRLVLYCMYHLHLSVIDPMMVMVQQCRIHGNLSRGRMGRTIYTMLDVT